MSESSFFFWCCTVAGVRGCSGACGRACAGALEQKELHIDGSRMVLDVYKLAKSQHQRENNPSVLFFLFASLQFPLLC